MEWDRQEELGGRSGILGGSIAGYAVMMKQQQQQHGADRRIRMEEEEAMAESIIITCRRNEARSRPPAGSRARLPCVLACLLAVAFTCRQSTSPHYYY